MFTIFYIQLNIWCCSPEWILQRFCSYFHELYMNTQLDPLSYETRLLLGTHKTCKYSHHLLLETRSPFLNLEYTVWMTDATLLFFWFPIRANCFKHDELNKTGETWVFYFSFSLGGSHKIIFVMKKWSKTTACKMGDALSQLTHWFCVCFSHNFQYLSWSIFQSFYLY